MKTEEKLLKYFIENKEEEVSIKELSRRVGADYKIVHVAVNRVIEEKLLEKRIVGNNVLLKYFNSFSPLIFKIEFERRNTLLKKKDFKVLYRYLDEFEFPLISLIFGSTVKGNFSKNSDIDLLIITDNKKEIENKLKLLPLKLDLNIFSYSEFVKMLQTKNFNLVSEAIRKNILLTGIEDYYRFLEVSKNA
jgi:predicted nucleotidyltransferase